MSTSSWLGGQQATNYLNVFFINFLHISFVFNLKASKQCCLGCSEMEIYIISCAGIILCMHPANETPCYIVTWSVIGWAHTLAVVDFFLGGVMSHHREKMTGDNYRLWGDQAYWLNNHSPAWQGADKYTHTTGFSSNGLRGTQHTLEFIVCGLCSIYTVKSLI